MLRLIEDIIFKLPEIQRGNSSYYKLIDLQNYLFEIEAEDIEIADCSLIPFYIDDNGTYEIYYQELKLNLVNEPMFERYIYMMFKKHSNEISPYFLKLHSTCFIESVLPNRFIKITDIVKWTEYVIEYNSNDEHLNKFFKKYFKDDYLDINKLRFDLIINNRACSIY